METCVQLYPAPICGILNFFFWIILAILFQNCLNARNILKHHLKHKRLFEFNRLFTAEWEWCGGAGTREEQFLEKHFYIIVCTSAHMRLEPDAWT